MAKYLILDKQEKFELTYEDFSQKFRKCFKLNTYFFYHKTSIKALFLEGQIKDIRS